MLSSQNAFAESNEQSFVAPGGIYTTSGPTHAGDGQLFFGNTRQPAAPAICSSFGDISASSAASGPSFPGNVFESGTSADLCNPFSQLLYDDPFSPRDARFQADHFGNCRMAEMHGLSGGGFVGHRMYTDHVANELAVGGGGGSLGVMPSSMGSGGHLSMNHTVNFMDGQGVLPSSHQPPFAAVDSFFSPPGPAEHTLYSGCSHINAPNTSPARTVRQRSRPPPTMRPPPVPSANSHCQSTHRHHDHHGSGRMMTNPRGPNRNEVNQFYPPSYPLAAPSNLSNLSTPPNRSTATINALRATNLQSPCDRSCCNDCNAVSVGGATLDSSMNRISNSNLYIHHPPPAHNAVADCSPSASLGARESSVTAAGSFPDRDAVPGDVHNVRISSLAQSMAPRSPRSPQTAVATVAPSTRCPPPPAVQRSTDIRPPPRPLAPKQPPKRPPVPKKTVTTVRAVGLVKTKAASTATATASSVHGMALIADKMPKLPDRKPIPQLIPPMEAIPSQIKLEDANRKFLKSEIPPSLGPDFKMPMKPLPDGPKKRFQCTMCNSHWFESEEALNLHINTHLIMQRTTKKRSDDPDRPWQCEVCNRKFAEKCTLKRHIRIHTNEKPWKCTFCTKAFNQSCSLQAHIRIHTGERPFPCDFCPKRFRQSTHRRQHCKRVHKEQWAVQEADKSKR